MGFRVQYRSRRSAARAGILRTAHGTAHTPFFMPIATRGAVKGLTADDVRASGSRVVLANTYHLWQRPGLGTLKRAGGLHRFMAWDGPILTDSGGYQVFSLSARRKITERGVEFRSEIDGKKHLLTPEKAIEIQHALGSDIIMSLDECPPYPSTRVYAAHSLALTTRWAQRGFDRMKKFRSKKQLLFGIVQGSSYRELRRESTRQLLNIGFDGYAIGGLAVGEPAEKMYQAIGWVEPLLPKDKPCYLMGVGKPEQIVEAVRRGVDMFDCVIPTRNARHGTLYVWKRRALTGAFYGELRIKQAAYAHDVRPIDPRCDCGACRQYSRAYIRHLMNTGDPLALRLATVHNVRFFATLMEAVRRSIRTGTL
ncbi:MAG: tRNA guanosine(34) transglycosylase Tgt [Patescibacteria group bacterium]